MWRTWTPSISGPYRRAAKSLREPADQPYGDRTGGVEDAFGNQWWIATHIEDVTPEEIDAVPKLPGDAVRT